MFLGQWCYLELEESFGGGAWWEVRSLGFSCWGSTMTLKSSCFSPFFPDGKKWKKLLCHILPPQCTLLTESHGKTEPKQDFLIWNIFDSYLFCFTCACVLTVCMVYHVHAVLTRAKRVHHIPCNWSYREFLATMWVLGIKWDPLPLSHFSRPFPVLKLISSVILSQYWKTDHYKVLFSCWKELKFSFIFLLLILACFSIWHK